MVMVKQGHWVTEHSDTFSSFQTGNIPFTFGKGECSSLNSHLGSQDLRGEEREDFSDFGDFVGNRWRRSEGTRGAQESFVATEVREDGSQQLLIKSLLI
ncbi:rCG59924 [Rattus norvegicus]|uniref:RCG59924 n=1 Tax=Rattus norvegicus TaxID=10116 RepID=A6HRU3_RAT|nr:rCG59924 [Rattus norvegicus]